MRSKLCLLPLALIACTDERLAFRRADAGSPVCSRETGASEAGAPDSHTPIDAGCFADAGSDQEGADRSGNPAVETPIIPVGLDGYRLWHRLPFVRIGARAYMRSTYDRAGNNEAADASHFLRQEAADRNVTLDVVGPGVLYFVRTNHWHGSPWHYVVDGADHLVQESSTADPNHPIEGSVFLPEAPFPNPLTWTWSVTRGADLNWVPMPFERSFTLAYGRTFYGTGYYIYHAYPEGAANLSAPIRSWQPEPPADDVLALLRRAGEDIAPAGETIDSHGGAIDLEPLATRELSKLTDGPRMIRAFKLRVSKDQAIAAARARLSITWDDRREASVDAPLALFFGTGSLYNRSTVEYLVRALLFSVRFTGDDVELATYFPMPYFSSARIALTGPTTALKNLRWELRTQVYDGPRNWVGYFHATYRDHGVPTPGRDLVVLDTRETEGGGDWCGNFAGMSWIFSERAALGTLEGDPRFFFDDSQSPQAYGTGTEEWGGGGDYWGGRTMTLPLAGHPVGAPGATSVLDPEDAIESAYRLLVADAMPFGKNARIQLEHGGVNDSQEHYHSVAYWYGAPAACLTLTDTLHVGDVEDERRHAYVSPAASPPEELRSRYEWGPDSLNGVEVFPATSDVGRHTTGTSEFTLALDPLNLGVLLRRKLDYSYPDQRAEVFVADDAPGAEFRRAGTWYLAGSNSCFFSFPPGETDPPFPIPQTSNRRFRDDEFLLPRALTEGRSRIRVRIEFTPAAKPLLPDAGAAAAAWSEFRYQAYSYLLPNAAH